ncbi:PAS domain-containing protein [Snodgrassella sp. CFCC 13594]|uniref:PAS domain-containing protein n=1 Tax=Snodgrassella sp. CFCC 13594 TaxID=1775559 RepID=UPI00082AF784|nr:PAS domain-containing protein [Snodgrassella sp. CFCC 13594]
MLLPMPLPQVAHRTYELTHYDGQVRTVYCTEEEKRFPDGCLITSTTDLEGIITHANDVFVDMSGWTREELMGAPHYILRHPDMPSVAYKDLWDTIQAGQKWHGYVKNLRKDGGFYWVYATIIPNIRNGVIQGYTSVRRNPSRSKVREMRELYAQMRLAEGNQ